MKIRLAHPDDWEALWQIIAPVFRAGRTYYFPTDITEAEARAAWLEAPLATYLAEEEGAILGTYFLRANHPGLGSHVCNCGYIVSEKARGRGVASLLCEHSQREGIARGFLAMQFNYVVSTNHTAVRLWKKHGYAIIGTIPGGFRHAELGFVDAYIMHKPLLG